jgi:hypothetical protein
MATSPNYSWPEPDNTDLVKNGALAIRTAVNAIDTSLGELLGGTTGQVLSKTSNTSMDFTWVTQDDANAIQNAIVDAKGDLISATANDTPARLAVGTNNSLLTADSAQATGLKYAGLWTTFTPTISGITLGNGSKSGFYCQIADTVFFRVILTFGSTTSFSGGSVDLTLPTTPSAYNTFDFMNIQTQVYDSSATAFYPSVANINVGTSGVRAATTNTAGTYAVYADIASTQPVIFATGDVLTWQGTYKTT